MTGLRRTHYSAETRRRAWASALDGLAEHAREWVQDLVDDGEDPSARDLHDAYASEVAERLPRTSPAEQMEAEHTWVTAARDAVVDAMGRTGFPRQVIEQYARDNGCVVTSAEVEREHAIERETAREASL